MTTTDEEKGWVTTEVGAIGFRADLTARDHQFAADEPTAAGGSNTAVTPYELLLGALGSCTAMTLRFYADRKKWPLEGVRVRMRSSRSHGADCANCETEAVGITKLDREIELLGPLTDEQRDRLLLVADRCPIKQTLERGIKVVPASA